MSLKKFLAISVAFVVAIGVVPISTFAGDCPEQLLERREQANRNWHESLRRWDRSLDRREESIREREYYSEERDERYEQRRYIVPAPEYGYGAQMGAVVTCPPSWVAPPDWELLAAGAMWSAAVLGIAALAFDNNNLVIQNVEIFDGRMTRGDFHRRFGKFAGRARFGDREFRSHGNHGTWSGHSNHHGRRYYQERINGDSRYPRVNANISRGQYQHPRSRTQMPPRAPVPRMQTAPSVPFRSHTPLRTYDGQRQQYFGR